MFVKIPSVSNVVSVKPNNTVFALTTLHSSMHYGVAGRASSALQVQKRSQTPNTAVRVDNYRVGLSIVPRVQFCTVYCTEELGC